MLVDFIMIIKYLMFKSLKLKELLYRKHKLYYRLSISQKRKNQYYVAVRTAFL
jgi:hypothetical protein